MSIKVIYDKDFCKVSEDITRSDFDGVCLVVNHFVSNGLARLPSGSEVKIKSNNCATQTRDGSVRWLVAVFEVQVSAPGYGSRAALLTCSRYFDRPDSSFIFSIDGNKTFLGRPIQLFDHILDDVV